MTAPGYAITLPNVPEPPMPVAPPPPASTCDDPAQRGAFMARAEADMDKAASFPTVASQHFSDTLVIKGDALIAAGIWTADERQHFYLTLSNDPGFVALSQDAAAVLPAMMSVAERGQQAHKAGDVRGECLAQLDLFAAMAKSYQVAQQQWHYLDARLAEIVATPVKPKP